MRQMKIQEVLEWVEEKRQLIDLFGERQARWIGHVMRNESLLKDVFLKEDSKEKGNGRQR